MVRGSLVCGKGIHSDLGVLVPVYCLSNKNEPSVDTADNAPWP